MKNRYLLFVITLFFAISTNAQFFDDMEYPNGPPYGPWWVPAPQIGGGTGLIPGDGTTEAILDLGNKTSEEWGLEFYMYVASGKEAYWNLQGTIPMGAGEWIVGNIYFNQDNGSPGIGLIDDSALGDVYFDFPHDEWFRIAMNFDLTSGMSNATWGFSIDNIIAIDPGTPFTNEAGDIPTSLGGVDFFSGNTNHEFYLDDFNYIAGVLDLAPTLGVEDLAETEFFVYPNPAQNILNIKTQEAIESVTIYTLLGNAVREMSTQQGSIDVSNLVGGMYFIEVVTSKEKSVQRFIKK